ncbi:class A beta-lactamase-related serine hydrolase [Flavihumibacter rivuli]|uniref:serine hydrolase n=1 Tax=Flavihumibacter rivuli TaxID=2838156 RepID=UPI001BDF5D74|nr:serine hydrolase [Flavihumibacter rivuli]ULQ55635.1 class A beta-lactamase-related serine hydrolase [Flavihumibacter rivuli]
MKKIALLLISFAWLFPNAMAQDTNKYDKQLERKMAELFKGFNGQAGVYVKNLRTGKVAAIHADTLFPTASMVKIPIMIGIMDKINNKELGYHQELIYKDSLLYEGEDILGSFKDGEKIALAKVLMLMLTTSDNTASLWLQALAGTGTRINQILDSLGFQNTRVNSRTPGREENRRQFGWGQTTPREMVRLMELIYLRQMLSNDASVQMLRMLGRNYWDEEAISQFPPDVFIASKNGAVDASRSETILVMAPHGPFIFSIITKNQQDRSWSSNNEGWVLVRKMANLLWQYFEPKSKWKPVLGFDGNPSVKRND